MSDYIIKDGELCHYGVKGMRWGVRKERIRTALAERDAKKLTKLGADYADKSEQHRLERQVAELNNTSNVKRIRKSGEAADRAKRKLEKFGNKIQEKYKDTPYSDIKVEAHANEGRIYVHALMGSVGNSPYDGTPLYRVEAGTWTKYRYVT